MDKADFDKLHEAQTVVPYDPLERVNMTRCAGNEWCEQGGMSGYFYAEHEPETGTFLEISTHSQLNVRLGTTPDSLLQHHVDDMLLPLATVELRVVATPKLQALLASLQALPGRLRLYMYLGVCAGVLASSVAVAWALLAGLSIQRTSQ